jgi:hypothetical protein
MIRVVIPDPDADFLPIPDPGSRGQKGIGFRIRNIEKSIFTLMSSLSSSVPASGFLASAPVKGFVKTVILFHQHHSASYVATVQNIN